MEQDDLIDTLENIAKAARKAIASADNANQELLGQLLAVAELAELSCKDNSNHQKKLKAFYQRIISQQNN